MQQERTNIVVGMMEGAIFWSRWILAVQYLGLVVALGAYSVKFVLALWDFLENFMHMDEGQTMLAALGLLDVLMMANLISMTLIGGYSSFVRKIDFAHLKGRPQGYSQLNAGMLKVKMAASLVGVSAIHLLKKFIDASENHSVTWSVLLMLISVHIAFLASLWVLARVDQMTHSHVQPEDTHA